LPQIVFGKLFLSLGGANVAASLPLPAERKYDPMVRASRPSILDFGPVRFGFAASVMSLIQSGKRVKSLGLNIAGCHPTNTPTHRRRQIAVIWTR
jgi:hypothetical protein